MTTAFDTFVKIVETSCCKSITIDSDMPDDVSLGTARIIANDVWLKSPSWGNTNDINSITLIEYLHCYSYSTEGHAKLREMMEYLSKYMDERNIEKGEVFTALWIEFHECVTPDGKNNYEERIKQKPINQIVEEDSVMIDIKNRKLDEVKQLVKEIHELDEKLDTKNIDPYNEGMSALLNIIEEEYDTMFHVM